LERSVLRLAVGLVSVAGLWLAFAAMADSRSVVIGGTAAVGATFLVAILLSLAAAQAWDRGARVRATAAFVFIGSSAALALYEAFSSRGRPGSMQLFSLTVGAAFVSLVLCGLAVVPGATRDRWISRLAGGCFAFAYLVFVLRTVMDVESDVLGRMGFASYAVGMAAVAVYALRARLARLAPPTAALPPR
jgi:hypothetical protein